jgi:hypothetical protein
MPRGPEGPQRLKRAPPAINRHQHTAGKAMFQMLGEQNEKYSRRFDCWRSNYHCDLDLDLFALGPFTQQANMAARLLFWAIIVLFWASLVLAVLGFYVTFWL